MTLAATIIISTLNGAARIEHPLRALALQEATSGAFEVVIVDNGSDAAGRIEDDHPCVELLRRKGIECRVVNENRRGLSHARIKGVLEARAGLVCFLDDDNVPCANYVAAGIEAFSDVETALLVSRLYPKYKAQPPRSIIRREHLLAINNKLGDEVITWNSNLTFAPTTGAGLWVRREIFLSAMPWQHPEKLLSDRQGKNLVSGGDIEIGYLVGRAGHKRVYRPELKLTHLIPETRLRLSYFCRLITGIVRSQLTLDVRYKGASYNSYRRATALLSMIFALCAAPVLLFREDGFREALFVLVSRWAKVIGPYTAISDGRIKCRGAAPDVHRLADPELAPHAEPE